MPTDTRAPAAQPWVALCYHDVQPMVSVAGGGPTRFSVPTAMFERMLDTIREEGFVGCSLADALRMPADARRVAITFDDANAGQFEHAMPALRARGMTATVYAAIEWIGTPGYMSWDDLRRITDWGMSVQSHSFSHPFLSECSLERLRHEFGESKARLDRELRQDTVEVAFPGGDPPSSGLEHAIYEAGYHVAVGTRWGRNTGTPAKGRFIKRCTVRGDITHDLARRYVHFDRWLATSQYLKETPLRTVRRTLGPTRYARWRKAMLDAVSGLSG